MKANIIYSVVAIIFFLILLLFIKWIPGFYLDYLWYESHQQLQVFWLNKTISYIFHFFGFLISMLIYLLFYILLLKNFKNTFPESKNLELIRKTFLIVAIILAFLIHGSIFSEYGFDFLLFKNASSYGLEDPILKKDISFYLFQLPFFQKILYWIQILIIFNIIFILIFFYTSISVAKLSGIYYKRDTLIKLGLMISILLGIFVISLGFGFFIAPYELIIKGTSSVVSGASYVDVHIKIPIYQFLFYVSIIIGISMLIIYFRKAWILSIIFFVSFIVIYFSGIVVFPAIYHSLRIKPNEFNFEKEYIENDLKFTRIAYKLDNVDKKIIDFKKELTFETLMKNQDILQNIRLWDYRPIKETLKQLQEIRPYYEFNDVDTDRYRIDGKLRQVIISAREINIAELPEQAKQWLSLHLQYTHGYGVVVAPSNEVNSEGLPILWIRDFPPVKEKSDFPDINRPEIYYGELTNHYVIVNTLLKEIDYPTESGFHQTQYEGRGGIEIGTGLRKLLISLNFDTWKILISEYIKPDSRILFHRNIKESIQKLANFLIFDSDPHIVIGKDGKLYWIIEAFTTSSRFPYSVYLNPHNILSYIQEETGFEELGKINYIRNSVKILIDAYEGTIQFYQFDEDPIIETYKKIYPKLIKDKSEFPEFLLPNVRYPRIMFFLQSVVFTEYHMEDPKIFYTKEDRWQIPSELIYENEQTLEPYYSIIRIEKDLETILMLPFIPSNKQNLISWMAVHSDFGNNYGRFTVFEIPRTKQIYGPMQIEARINQDAEISKDLTLWNQQGSSVIRGNLLIIPVEENLLYIEPIYLQSSQSPFPEFKRVIISNGVSIAMGESIEDSLQKLYSNFSFVEDNKETRKDNPLLFLLKKAKEQLSRGNWIEFGKYMNELEKELEKLE